MTSAQRPRLLYIDTRRRGAPPANKRFGDALESEFTEFDMDVVYVSDLFRAMPVALIKGSLAALLLYRNELARRQKRFSNCVLRTPQILHDIRRQLRRETKDRSYTFSIQVQSLFDCRLDGVPHFVYTDHTHLANLEYGWMRPDQLYHPSWIDCERVLYQESTSVLTWSAHIGQSLVQDYGLDPSRVEQVNAGPSVPIVSSDQTERDPHNILFVGKDWQRKGGPTLLAAFSRVRQIVPDATLTIVGCQPDVSAHAGVAAMGSVPPENLPKYFQRASIFCLPTHLEPFGIAVIEAMHYELPVITTNIGAMPDFVGNGVNGYLVQPGDVDALASRLLSLLQNPERAKSMGEAARRAVSEDYTWPAVARKVRAAVEKRLSPPTPAGG